MHLALACASPLAAYQLVLTTGRTLDLAAIPTFTEGWTSVVTRAGRAERVPELAVSWTKTNVANGLPPEHRPPGASLRKAWTAPDLRSLRSSRYTVDGEPSAASSPGAPTALVPEVSRLPPGDEASWRARGTEAETRIATSEATLAYLKDQERAWESVALNLPSLGGGAAQEIAHAREQIAATQAELDQARAALAALEDEARRARIPPGWIRP